MPVVCLKSYSAENPKTVNESCSVLIEAQVNVSTQPFKVAAQFRIPLGVLTTQGIERITPALRIPLQQESGRSIRCTYSWRRERHDCGGRFLRDNFAFHDTTTDFHRKGKSLTGAILGDHFRVTGERERTGGGDRERRDGDVHNGD
jgi:hypothetical protein